MASPTIHSLCQVLGFSDKHGFCATCIPQVTFFRAAHHEATCPQKYDSGLVFILQGYKLGQANGQTFRTGSDRFLILTNTYPVLCETFASDDVPLLGLYVGLDMPELQRLTQVMAADGPYAASRSDVNQALVSCPMNDNIRGALQYLVTTLHSETASKALGSSCLARLYFSVLTCPQGSALKELARSDSKLSRVSAAMRFMEKNLDQKIAMDAMAARVGLSLSAFHRIFKEATDESPLQYLKKIRLTKAKNLMVYQDKPAYLAALEVGYESPTQFSREFKRYFGLPPSRVDELPYNAMVGVE